MIDHPNRASAERLNMLSEECAKVIQIISKIQRHGWSSYHPDDVSKTMNYHHLLKEIADVQAVITGMVLNGDIALPDELIPISEPSIEVWQRKLKWTHHQNKEALLDPLDALR